MMHQVSQYRLLTALLFGLSLILAGCAGAGGDAVGGRDKLAFSAFYEQSANLRKMPPLHERGVDSLVILYVPQPHVVLRSFGSFSNQRSSEVDNAVIIPEGFVEERLMAEAAGAVVKIRLASEEEGRLPDYMTASSLTDVREFDEAGQAILAKMKAAGVDAVLLAEEPETLANFLFAGGLLDAAITRLPPKGLVYRPRWGAYAMAGVRFVLIDTASGKQIPNTGFTQVSAERITLRWQHLFDLYPPGHQQVLRTMVRDRLAKNARVMLQLVKAIPGDDGAYLTYDPAEQDRSNRAYPQ